MATAAPNTITADAAAQILRIAPGELTKLVSDGVIPRVAPGQFHPGAIIAAYIEYLRTDHERRERASQAEIAAHLDISDRRLRELLTEWGVNHKQTTLTDIRLRYIRKLREEAAGRQAKGDESIDLVQERALLAREQRIKIARSNALERGENAPIGVLTDILATASAAVSDRLDALPAAIMRTCPDLPASVRSAIESTVHNARVEWHRETTKQVATYLAEVASPDQDTEEAEATDRMLTDS